MGHTIRPATPADADLLFAVALARDMADVGRSDWTPADIRTELSRSDGDALLVEGDDGRAVAFATVSRIDAAVLVHPDAEGRGIGTALREDVERRARGPVLRQEILSANEGARALLEAAGYEHEQRYWRMERELTADEPAPSWPLGAEPRAYERGRDDRPAYELIADAMSDIPGDTEQPFEEWRVHALGEALAPDLSIVAGDMAAVALCQRHPGGEGYVDYIAVARDWRGRGLGRALLQASFKRFADEGMRRATLWVNGKNESATRLYRSAGMEVGFSADRLVKCLPPR